MSRKTVSSNSPFEEKIGFSRAKRIGNIIAVSGTAPLTEAGATACHGDAYGQTRRCLEIIQKAIEDAGGKLEDVIRTRLYLVDVHRWKECGRAHAEFFGEIKPASTFVEVSHLIRSDWLVEIEAECVIEEE
ncbi:MAG: RidA family protein [Cyanobacteria bacterium HKST-UBA02]|nr:RidA family protein [Cyanobacteria bacterium HKST-UBA02]